MTFGENELGSSQNLKNFNGAICDMKIEEGKSDTVTGDPQNRPYNPWWMYLILFYEIVCVILITLLMVILSVIQSKDEQGLSLSHKPQNHNDKLKPADFAIVATVCSLIFLFHGTITLALATALARRKNFRRSCFSLWMGGNNVLIVTGCFAIILYICVGIFHLDEEEEADTIESNDKTLYFIELALALVNVLIRLIAVMGTRKLLKEHRNVNH